VFRSVTIYGVRIGDHLSTPLGTTFYKSLTRTDWCPQSITVSISRFLATASTEGHSSASRTQVLLSQPPVQNSFQVTTQLTGSQAGGHVTPTSLLFSPQADFQLNSLTTSYFTSLHFTSLHFTSLHFTSLHFTSLHFTQLNC
jgi:hypothetical protein